MYHGEKFNAWTHLIGALLALTGAVWLLVLAIASGDGWKIFGVAVYGATLVLLYSISTIYHSVRGRAKRVLRKLDHLSIYLLIAGSYTPFCLITLRGPWGWSLFGIVWTLAVAGTVLKSFNRLSHPWLSTGLYLVMGWLVLVAAVPLVERVPLPGLVLLAAGGIAYTAGVAFYALDSRLRYGHAVWHGFVAAGSGCHFFAVLNYAA